MKSFKENYPVTSTRVFKFKGNLEISLEVSDTENGFAFRLKSKTNIGDWQTNWTLFARLLIGERCFMSGTMYWNGVFPIEEPFEVIEKTEEINPQYP